MKLDFDNFSYLNASRCQKSFGYAPEDYTDEAFALGLAGEAGEVAQGVKKLNDYLRTAPAGEHDDATHDMMIEHILDEISDVVTYADLLCTFYGHNLSEVLARKFNIVSERVGSNIKIPV